MIRHSLLVIASLLAFQAGMEAADDESVPLNDLTAQMRRAGRSQAEIDAFLDWQIALRGIHEYLALYRQEHDAGRIRAITGLRPPSAMVMSEVWPLLHAPLDDDAFASVLLVVNEGNHAPAIPAEDRQFLWESLARTNANVRQQLLRAIRTFGPYTPDQVGRLGELTRDAADYVRCEAVKTIDARPDSPGAADVLVSAMRGDEDEAALLATEALVGRASPNGALEPSKIGAALNGPDAPAVLAKIRSLDDRAFLRQALRILPDAKIRLTCRAWFVPELKSRKLQDAEATVRVLPFMGKNSPAYLQILTIGYVNQFGTSEPATQGAFSKLVADPDADIAYWTCQVLLHEGAVSAFAIPIIDRQLQVMTAQQSHVFSAYLDLIERNPQLGGVVQKTLTTLVRENAVLYAGQNKMTVSFMRARTLDVLAKVADPSGASVEIADLVINGDQPAEQVAALRALARLSGAQRDAILPHLSRYLDPAFDDRIIDGTNIRHREAPFSSIPARNTTPRIEAIRTILASGPDWARTYRTTLAGLAAVPTDVKRTRHLIKDYPAWAAEALATAK